MNKVLADLLINQRLVFFFLFTGLSLLIAVGAQNLYFEGDFKKYFDDDDPMLLAHEAIEQSYTSTDNVSFLIKSKQGDLFQQSYLQAISKLTKDSWQTPYSVRVDSLTNFQHMTSQNDELIIKNFINEPNRLDEKELDDLMLTAIQERELVHRFISESGDTTLVNIMVELPTRTRQGKAADTTVSDALLKLEREARNQSFSEVVDYADRLANDFRVKNPDLELHITGVTALNETFNTHAKKTALTLIPLMFLLILFMLYVILRSLGSMVGIITVIVLASMAASGFTGLLYIPLNTIVFIFPIVILTISVCNTVHLQVIYLRQLVVLNGDAKAAMAYSLRTNLQPIFLTSITTAIGFLSLNFSDSPNFRDLGNIIAFGVLWSMVLTFTILPTLSLWLVKQGSYNNKHDQLLKIFSGFVTRHYKSVFAVTLLLAFACITQIPRNEINDDPVKYFKKGVPYRDAADFTEVNLPGLKTLTFSLPCHNLDCTSTPQYLHKLKDFVDWLEQQEGVEYVTSYVDVIRRLNKHMNGGDETYYKIPENELLTAQYHLLYELSLPYGLDMNNQVDFDKSQSLVRVFLNQVRTSRLIEIEQQARAWLETNFDHAKVSGTGANLMFANLGEKNIQSMAIGALGAIFFVTLTILIALRSIKFSVISLLPNVLPAAIALGVWGMLIGHVNLTVSSVFSITLGIIVDDTIHFISKYQFARQHKGYNPEQAIEYAFMMVGKALIVTTIVLSVGFGLLIFSPFNLNAYLGALTAITIIVALIFDFLIMPSLLLLVDKA